MPDPSERTQASPGPYRDVPFMGVIFVVTEAMKLGFRNGHPDWCNLGQGQPECGEMEGAPPRLQEVSLDPGDHMYGPLEGIDEMREVVAAHYNRLYRQGKASQYTAKNVCVASGGRLALTRAMAILEGVNVGYQLPDYSAYEDMFNLHMSRCTPIPVTAPESDGFQMCPDRFRRAVRQFGLEAFVLSNPCNPTGNVVRGEELADLVKTSREHKVTFLLDEFYSHFIYTPDGQPDTGPVSGASYVEDVNEDRVLLFDGLTKSYRYPGWRVGWVVGPEHLVDLVARAASSIDGGPSRIAQRAAIQVLEPARADQETTALRDMFSRKRNVLVSRLENMGITFARKPESTFYGWACLRDLPEPFDHSVAFFREALKQKVMTVPGEFFDVNPGRRRRAPSEYEQWMRFSFGPPMDNLVLGLDRLDEMLKAGRVGAA